MDSYLAYPGTSDSAPYTYILFHIHIYVSYTYTHIYIHTDRKREKEKESTRQIRASMISILAALGSGDIMISSRLL